MNVENKNVLTYDDLIFLRVLVENHISHNEDHISFLKSSLLSPVEISEDVASCEKLISSDKIIVEKLKLLSTDAYKKSFI